VGVLVSGRGTNLRALLEAASQPRYPARIAAVASNRPRCPGLTLAEEQGVPTRCFPLREFAGDTVSRDREMAVWLLRQQCRILVLAGYDRILTEPVLSAFPGRILNLHNSLLPSFPGTMNAVGEALAAGVKVTGCTVHLVDPGKVDGGPILMQAAVEVRDDDDEASLWQRIHEQEWRVLPEAVRLLSLGRVQVEGGRAMIR